MMRSIQDGYSQLRVTFLSAHRGAEAWIEMCDTISQTSRFVISIIYHYDDKRYRKPTTWFGRAVLRFRTYVAFPLRCLLDKKTIISQSDILLVNTSPFFLPILISLFYPRNVVKIALMNDIYPEALVQNNIIKRGGAFERILNVAFQRSLKQFQQIVVISGQHLRFFKDNYRSKLNLCLIPVPAQHYSHEEARFDLNDGVVRILYCGTLGLMHEIETFLEWYRNEPGWDYIRIQFCTSGAQKTEFERRINGINATKVDRKTFVELGDSLDRDAWIDIMKKHHIGLVFQGLGAGNVVFPSKMASILVAGQAVLAIADRGSEVAKMIIDNDCGWVVEPGDAEGLDRVFSSLSNESMVNAKRRNAYVFGNSYFGREAVSRKWQDLFYRCCRGF